MGAYDYSIEKAVYYLENKTPKTDRGKERFEFVRRLLSYMRREREAFSANAQIKEREMNAERASHVNGGNILLDIRADVAREVENDALKQRTAEVIFELQYLQINTQIKEE